MLIDAQTLLSSAQVVTVTAFSANQYDTGAVSPPRNLGRKDLRLVITVDEAATAAGAATVNFELGEADDAAGTNYQTIVGSAAIGKAAILAGTKQFDVPVPDTSKRFIMARYVVGTGPLTAGKFTAALVRGSDHQRIYPDGYTQAN